jgi:HK97 family phage portal protein
MKFINKLMSRLGFVSVSDTVSMRQWREFYSTTTAGERVTPETSMQLTAVMACVRVLADNIGSLPVPVYRKNDDDGREKISDNSVSMLLKAPNDYQTGMEWKSTMAAHVVLRGNAYSIITWSGTDPVELAPIHPDRMTVERLKDGSLRYKVMNPFDGSETKYSQDRVLHIPGLSFDGMKGINPIEYCASTLGLSLAAEKFGGSFFANGANAGAVLTTPVRLSKDAVNNIRHQIEQNHSGAWKANRVLILQEDLKWNQMSVPPDQAQFLETRKFQVTDIARMFGVPPHMIGDLERATFSNIEEQGMNFVTYSLRPWFVRFEQQFNKKLLLDDPNLYCEFLADALQRGNQKSRFESYSLALASRWMTPNEVRKKENMDPIDGGDELAEKTNLSSNNGGSKLPGQKQEDNPEEEPKEKPNGAMQAWIEDVSQRLANKALREPISTIKAKTEHAKYMFQCIHPILVSAGTDCSERDFDCMDSYPTSKDGYSKLIQGLLK